MSKDVQSRSANDPLHILRLPAVMDRVGLSRSSIYSRMRSGCFPQAVNLGGRAIGFVDREIEDWVRSAADRRSREAA